MRVYQFCLLVIALCSLLGFSMNVASAQSYTPGSGNILYVDINVASGDGSGNSWSDAIPQLADALQWARDHKDQWSPAHPLLIYVAEGIYKPKYNLAGMAAEAPGLLRSFYLVNHVELYGGFNPSDGITDIDHTRIIHRNPNGSPIGSILSGDVDNNDVGVEGLITNPNTQINGQNVYNVVFASETNASAILDGFTITGGYAAATTGSASGRTRSGGGIYIEGGSPSLKNLFISGNRANYDGGGIQNFNGSHPTLTELIIVNNVAGDLGGGIINRANSNPTIIRSIISGNLAIRGGGGMLNHGSTATIINSLISGNRSNGQGGGIYNYQAGTTLVNVTISGNSSGGSVSGFYNDNSQRPMMVNTIIWGNGPDNGAQFNGSAHQNSGNNLIRGNNTSVTVPANLHATDIFLSRVEAAQAPTILGDYRLKENSIAINRGSDVKYRELAGQSGHIHDLLGNPRSVGRIDIGAYETSVLQLAPDENNIFYVDQNAFSGNGQGHHWDHAVRELADVLRWAEDNQQNGMWTEQNPLKVYIAVGTYRPRYRIAEQGINGEPTTDRDITFVIPSNIQLYGGFNPRKGVSNLNQQRFLPKLYTESRSNETILSGDIDGIDGISDNDVYHVAVAVETGNSTLIDGIAVEGGNARTAAMEYVMLAPKNTANGIMRRYGGGISVNEGYLSIRNTSIRDNFGFYTGGLEISKSRTEIANSYIIGNQSSYNAGMSHVQSRSVMKNVLLTKNLGNLSGAIINQANSVLTMSNLTIVGNWSSFRGGGVYNTGIFHAGDDSRAILHNSIVWANGNINNVSWIDDASRNNIVQYDNLNQTFNIANIPSQLTLDDLFVAPLRSGQTSLSEVSYRPKNESFGIDIGSNSLYNNTGVSAANDKDMDGNNRLTNGRIDIGAYETSYGTISPRDGILYVDANVASDYGSGSSWEYAIKDLSEALKWAQDNQHRNLWNTNNPLKIFVAKGKYTPTYKLAEQFNNGEATTEKERGFLLVKDVQIYGGFDPDQGIRTLDHHRILPDTTGLGGTILSGDIDDNDQENGTIVGVNVSKVVLAVGDNGNAILDGVTVSGAQYETARTMIIHGEEVWSAMGGGITLLHASLGLKNATICHNQSSSSALAIMNSSSFLEDVNVVRNTSTGSGGGIYISMSPDLRMNRMNISNNVAVNVHGGGIYSSGNYTLTNSIISGNRADAGGGIYCSDSPRLTNVLISGNQSRIGGGIGLIQASPVLINVTISDNRAGSGSGIHGSFNSSPLLMNTILMGDEQLVLMNSSSFNATSRNNIIQSGHSSNIAGFKSSMTASDIFVKPIRSSAIPSSAGDYRLRIASPAIDAGSNTAYHSAVGTNPQDDLDALGLPRLNHEHIDLGAFESTSAKIEPVAGILYVNKHVDDDKTDILDFSDQSGSNWEQAISELSDALKWAKANEDRWTSQNPLQIYVAKGVYYPTEVVDQQDVTIHEQQKSFQLVNHVHLYGGFDPNYGITAIEHARIFPGSGEHVDNGSILSGDIDGNDNQINNITSTVNQIAGKNTHHVVTINPEVQGAIINEFIINAGDSPTDGAGLFNDRGDVSLKQVVLVGNRATRYGGGIYTTGGSLKTLNTLIIANESTDGAGVYSLTGDPVFDNTTISANKATQQAGGVYAASGLGTVKNSIIWGNGDSPNFVGSLYSVGRFNLVQGRNISGPVEIPQGLMVEDLFLDPLNTEGKSFGNYRLVSKSIAVNNGDKNFLWYTIRSQEADPVPSSDDDARWGIDLAGNRRLQGGFLDLGAYESSFENLESLSGTVEMEVAYGTELTDIELPADYQVTGMLNNGENVEIKLDANPENWVITIPNNGMYNGMSAGTYQFEVPLILPNDELQGYSNSKGLKANVTVRVKKKEIDLVMNGLRYVYDGNEKAVGFASLPENLTGLQISYDGKTDLPVSVGSYAVSVSLINENYEAEPVSGTLVIEPKNVTIGFREDALISKVYDGTNNANVLSSDLSFSSGDVVQGDELSLVLSSGNAHYDTKDAGKEKEITLSLAGITLSGNAKDNYSIANTSAIIGDVGEIDPRDLEIHAINHTIVFNNSYYSGGHGVNYNGFAPDEDERVLSGELSYTGSSQGAIGAGTYVLMPGGLSSSNYSINYISGVLTISGGVANILNFNVQQAGSLLLRTYGDGDVDGSAISSSGLIVEYSSSDEDVAIIDNNGQIHIVGVGETILTARQGGNVNYAPASPISINFQVDPKILTVTARHATKVYDGQSYHGGNGVTYSGFIDGEDDSIVTGEIQYSGSSQQAVGTGRYEIIPSGLQAPNYSMRYISGNLDIIPRGNNVLMFKDQTAGGSLSLTYGASAISAVASATSGLSVSYSSSHPEVATINTDGIVHIIGVGHTVITASQPGDSNHEAATDIRFDIEIVRAPLIITANNKTKVYDQQPNVGGNGVQYTGFVYNDDESLLSGTLVYKGTSQDVVNTGSYSIIPEGLSSPNYSITYRNGSLSITKRPVTIGFREDALISKVYDGTNNANVLSSDLSFSSGDVVQGDKLSLVLSSGNAHYDTKDAGKEKEVTLSLTGITLSGNAKDNYSIANTSPISGDVGEITPFIPAGLSMNSQRYIYDGTIKSLIVEGELPNGSQVFYENNTRKNVGVQEVLARITGDNLATIELTAKLTIDPAPLLLILDDQSKLLGSEDQEYTFSLKGLMGNDTHSEVISGASARVLGEQEGSYTIGVGTLKSNNNYQLEVEEGTLFIYKGIDLFVDNNNAITVYGDEEITLIINVQHLWKDGYQPGEDFILNIEKGQGLDVSAVESNFFSVLDEGSSWKLRIEREWISSDRKEISLKLIGDGNFAGRSLLKLEAKNPKNQGYIVDSELQMPVEIEEGAHRIITSNVFTPNGDGINDTFQFSGLELHDRAELTVLNQYGNQVYKNLDYKNDWTAPNIQDGTYFYILEVWRYSTIQKRNVRSFFRGWVLIKRD